MLIPGLEHKIILNQIAVNNSKIYPSRIMDIVSKVTLVPIPQITSKSRKREIADARHLFLYFCKKHCELTLSAIGLYAGHVDHSTVNYAVKSIENLRERDMSIMDKYEKIRILIKSDLNRN